MNSQVTSLSSVSLLSSAPSGTYEVEGSATSNRGIVTIQDSSLSVEATCGNNTSGCEGSGLIKISKMGSKYTVLNLIKRPTRQSLNKIIDAEPVTDSLIRILIKTDAGEEWVELSLNKTNVDSARDLVLNKNLNGWMYDVNTLSLSKTGE